MICRGRVYPKVGGVFITLEVIGECYCGEDEKRALRVLGNSRPATRREMVPGTFLFPGQVSSKRELGGFRDRPTILQPPDHGGKYGISDERR